MCLENSAGGPFKTTCWLVGGGPGLCVLPLERISASQAPVMTINLAGYGLIKPNYWTSYDPTNRFLAETYLDPGIKKFVHKRRAMDLVPETTYKVCESPELYFFEKDCKRTYTDFLGQQHLGIVDWADSFVQAIDILYRLGFRRVLMAGCDMQITPSPEMCSHATTCNIEYKPGELLSDFVKQCEAKGISLADLEKMPREQQYHFNERKSLKAAMNTDYHYFKVVQYLRLSRRSLAAAGVELISVTPQSRLNDFFPYVDAEMILEQLQEETKASPTVNVTGLYTQNRERIPLGTGPMRDFKPHGWNGGVKPVKEMESPQEKTPMIDEAAIDVLNKKKAVQKKCGELLVE